jgi:hypothetical protein
MKLYVAITSTLACILALAALTVSITHAEPVTSQAQTARLGFCWESDYQQVLSGGASFVENMNITPANLSDGVYACPDGEVFVSVVPQTTSANNS